MKLPRTIFDRFLVNFFDTTLKIEEAGVEYGEVLTREQRVERLVAAAVESMPSPATDADLAKFRRWSEHSVEMAEESARSRERERIQLEGAIDRRLRERGVVTGRGVSLIPLALVMASCSVALLSFRARRGPRTRPQSPSADGPGASR